MTTETNGESAASGSADGPKVYKVEVLDSVDLVSPDGGERMAEFVDYKFNSEGHFLGRTASRIESAEKYLGPNETGNILFLMAQFETLLCTENDHREP